MTDTANKKTNKKHIKIILNHHHLLRNPSCALSRVCLWMLIKRVSKTEKTPFIHLRYFFTFKQEKRMEKKPESCNNNNNFTNKIRPQGKP